MYIQRICEICEGNLIWMGCLGNKDWFKCRNCGMQFAFGKEEYDDEEGLPSEVDFG